MGGGAMQAAKEMARLNREMNAYMAQRRARRARRRALARMGGVSERIPQKVDYPCFFLCTGCHFMMREPGAACPACGGAQWLDLADMGAADTLRDVESAARMKPPVWVKASMAGGALAVFGGIVAATAAALPALVAAGVGVPLTYALGLRPMSVLLTRLSKDRPARWHLPEPLPADGTKPEREVTGETHPVGDLIEAPFTGIPCIAYQACVLFDTPGDARPPQWVSQEVMSVDFEVGGHQIAGDRTIVKTPLEPVSPETLEEAGVNLAHFLRERGLFFSDGEFDLFESRILPGDPVTVALYDDPPTAFLLAR